MSQGEQPVQACKRVKGGKFSSKCSQGRSVINYRSRGVSPESLLAQGSSDYSSSFRGCSSSILSITKDTEMCLSDEEDAAHALYGLGDPEPMDFNTFMTHMNEMIKNMATMTGATAGGQASAEMNRQSGGLSGSFTQRQERCQIPFHVHLPCQ